MGGLNNVASSVMSISEKTTAYRKLIGERQTFETTFDLAQAAAAYDLFTGSAQVFILTEFVFRMPASPDLTDDATITSIAIATDDAEPVVIFDSTAGAKANLTQDGQLGWTGVAIIAVGSKIQITIAGGAADAATVATIEASGFAAADGGTLV